MTIKPNPASMPPAPDDSGAEETAKPSLGPVRVQKRVPASVSTHREKLCANCGRPFSLTAEQKFYICPDCYQKSQAVVRKPIRPKDAQLLIQIACVDCGAVEYVSFVPQDPQATYCKTCFQKRKRQNPNSNSKP